MDDRLIRLLVDKTEPAVLPQMLLQLMAMRGTQDDPMPLHDADFITSIEGPGEFFILTAAYEDLEAELHLQAIKRHVGESLAIVAAYEDDGNSLPHIENFVRYIHGLSDPSQHAIFGIKKVTRLGEQPVKILFGGILPINQLRMRYGTAIAALLEREKDHFIPLFAELRQQLSQAIGLPILPLFPDTDPSLPPNRVILFDPTNGQTVCRFDVERTDDKKGLDLYLMKLYYTYLTLGEQMRKKLMKDG
jgi:hypothetical protein